MQSMKNFPFVCKFHQNLSVPGDRCTNAKRTSGKKPIGGALFWHMRGAYGMRHHCHATNNSLLVAHVNMRHAYVEYWRI
jgi:hypothetical protein